MNRKPPWAKREERITAIVVIVFVLAFIGISIALCRYALSFLERTMIPYAAWQYLKENEGEVYEEPNGTPTKYGVEIRDFQAYLKYLKDPRQATKQDIEGLSEGGARLIYDVLYWTPARLDEITNPRVQTKLFDTLVKMGATGMALIAQIAVNTVVPSDSAVKIDGIFGPITRARINKIEEAWDSSQPDEFLEALRPAMAGMIVQRVLLQPQFKADEAGWLARAFREPQ